MNRRRPYVNNAFVSMSPRVCRPGRHNGAGRLRLCSTQYSIRPLGKDDHKQFVAVCAECFFEAPMESFSFRSRRVRAELLLSKWIRSLSPRVLEGYAIISAKTGRICGVVEVTVEQVGQGDLWSFLFGAPSCAYVQNLGVVRDERRKGLASRLVQNCEVRARKWGYDELFLHVVEDNIPALEFYTSMNYSVVSRDPKWIRLIGRAPLILLSKHLL